MNLQQQIKEALEIASSHPWKWVGGDAKHNDLGRIDDAVGWTICDFGNNARYYPTAGKEPDEADYSLIVNAPTWLQQLLDENERLRTEHAAMKEALEKISNQSPLQRNYCVAFDRCVGIADDTLATLSHQKEADN